MVYRIKELCPDISLTRIGHTALDLFGIIPRFDGCEGINAGSRIIGKENTRFNTNGLIGD